MFCGVDDASTEEVGAKSSLFLIAAVQDGLRSMRKEPLEVDIVNYLVDSAIMPEAGLPLVLAWAQGLID